MLLREIKKIYHKELDAIYPNGEVDSFFYLLIEHYLDLERFALALQPELAVTKKEEQPLFEALAKLRLQHPLQYIIGTAHFMDLDFKVNADVLIPRPETEDLVRWIVAEVRSMKNQVQDTKAGEPKDQINILDIGTGSGCIAIALAKNLPNAKLVALDISEKALAVAKANAIRHNVDIEFLKADILQLEKLETQFNIIVSNPPYVRQSEKKNMHQNVLGHEPATALFVADENPLLFYGHIARFAKEHLVDHGVLFLEINQYLGKETKALLLHYNFSEIELRKDMFENARMLKCKMVPPIN